MKLVGTLLAGTVALLACATPASAGTYRIYACDAGGKIWDNRAWAVEGAVAAGTVADVACPTKGDPIQVRAGAGATTASGAQTILSFKTQPGTTISDFSLNRRLFYNNPAVEGFHPFHSLYVLGTGTVFAGAGDHPSAPALTQQNAWYANPADTRGVTVNAGDASGIRRVEIIDVSDPAQPRVVGFEEYDPDQGASTLTDAKGGCSWRLTKPCPSLSGETVRATALEPGRRTLLVRTLDAAANVTDQGPFDVDVVTPSDRGAPNGDLHRDTFVDRGAVTTGTDGSFSYLATAYASRQIQFGWLARTRDTRFAANAYIALKACAKATLRAPRTVRVGQTFSLTGRFSGLRPARAPAIVVQGRVGRRRYEPFRNGLASSRGTFRLRYRFKSPASRGRKFSIRVLLLPRGGWPYEDGVTRTVRVRVR